jgi:hypothetical protein
MALVLEANYSKKLGLPGYSSHQFSLTVRAELADVSQVDAESEAALRAPARVRRPRASKHRLSARPAKRVSAAIARQRQWPLGR